MRQDEIHAIPIESLMMKAKSLPKKILRKALRMNPFKLKNGAYDYDGDVINSSIPAGVNIHRNPDINVKTTVPFTVSEMKDNKIVSSTQKKVEFNG